MLIIFSIIIALWLLSGWYQVQPGNKGVVQRFGKHVQTASAGWGWRIPWPIETVTKVDVAGVKSTEYKSSVLTAEPNMVELQVAVQYRIKDAEDYLFRVRDPKDTLSEVSESAIREVVGRNDQQAILEAGRIKIADDTRVIMQRTLDQYGAGIEVRSVNITDVQVPEAVQQAQRDSVKAKADRERLIKEAQAYANGILPKAQGDAARAVQEAEAYKSQVSLMATGDASRFTALALAYEKSPEVTRERLYIETVESVLKTSRKVLIDSKSGNGNMLYLPLDKLIDRRDSDVNTVTVRPPAGGEPDPVPSTDARQRVER
jgi:membrane protease subunit HflK